MAKLKPKTTSWLQATAVRLTRAHFFYIAAYLISIVVFDSWNLLTHDATAQRWTAGGIFLAVNTALWYLSRMKFRVESLYAWLVIILVAVDIVFASANVSWERGLASKAVALFAIPIVVAAALRSRTTLLATISMCVAAYSTVAIRYFNQHYGESYRIELYGYIAFYSAIFFVLGALLWVIIRPDQSEV